MSYEAYSLASVRLNSEIYQSIEIFGLDKTIEILHSARIEALQLKDETIGNVLKIVSRQFQISVYELLYGVGRKNDRPLAVGLCVHYLKNDFKYSMKEIISALRRDRFNLWRHLQMVKQLNEKNLSDQPYIEMKKKCDVEIEKLKLSDIKIQ